MRSGDYGEKLLPVSKRIQLKYIPFVVFLVFGLLVYVQHCNVYMYFDDFGYASLTYGTAVGDGGLDYSLVDVFKFLKWHYLNWGGRIIPFFAEIVILREGVWFFRIIQTLIIVGIYVCMYLFLKTEDQKKNVASSIILVSLFASIGLLQMRNGCYWFTASVLYLWPILPFLAAVLLQKEEPCSKSRALLNAVLLFLAGFSYEQYAIMVIVYSAFILAEKLLVDHRVSKGNIIGCAAGIVGGLCEIFAPGNFARTQIDIYEEFYSTSFLKRTLNNLPRLIDVNLGEGGEIYVLFICATIVGIIVALDSRGKASAKAKVVGVVVVGSLATTYVLGHAGLISNTIIIEGCIALMFIVCTVAYSLHYKKYLLLGLLIAGLCSQGMMLISPTIPERCALPFTFIMHLLIASELIDVYKADDRVQRPIKVGICCTVVGLLVILSWGNFFEILQGYMGNAVINETNHYKLLEKAERFKAGEKTDYIILYKLENDWYASDMPYQQDFMEYWWKEFYDLPQDIQFLWVDYKEKNAYREEVVFDEIKLVSIWPEVVDDTLEFHDNGSLDIAAVPNIFAEKCKIVVNGEVFNTRIGEEFLSTTVPAEMLDKDLEISILNATTGQITNSLIMRVK